MIGVEKETGFTLNYDKYNWEEHQDHFILADTTKPVDFGEGKKSMYAYEPADGSYKRKEEVRCLKTADFTKTPDFLHLRTAIACSREENAQDKKV